MHLIIPALTGNIQPRVNLKELGIVRQEHMPPHLVRFAPEPELSRVADEVARQQPELREEVDYVVGEELYRRGQLATSPLVAMRGGLNNG